MMLTWTAMPSASICDLGCAIPVVFISYVDDPSQKRGSVYGVDYITKPFHDAEVLARVRRTHIMK